MIDTIPKAVVMIRPAAFGFNPETAANNVFQMKQDQFTPEQVQDIALLEFNNMANLLRDNGIHVHIFDDNAVDKTPDSIFPNNWLSTFTSEILLYPMFSENRRRERKKKIYTMISALSGKPVNSALLNGEEKGKILEGTGSLVCDYANKVAFASLSPRTTSEGLDEFEKISDYRTVRFEALGPNGEAIYHTNVMMTMADDYCLIGMETIASKFREQIKSELEKLGKEIIDLTFDQVYNNFAGNMLQVANDEGHKCLVMSVQAYRSLSDEQKIRIETAHQNKIIAVPIHMIEKIGGGSVRCMMAEMFSIHEND